MTGKQWIVLLLMISIAAMGGMNWWNYLKEEGKSAGAPSKRERPASTASAQRRKPKTLATFSEPEPPKRLPKTGRVLKGRDPFTIKKTRVIRRVSQMAVQKSRLDLILFDDDNPLASINGVLYAEGEVVGRKRLIQIEREGVLLKGKGKKETYLLLDPQGIGGL